MIRYYALFVVSDEMMNSPYLQRYRALHDCTLYLNEVETVNFLLQTPIDQSSLRALDVLYDPGVVTITKIKLTHYEHQTILTTTLIPKELGSHRIGFSYPVNQTDQLHQPASSRLDPFRRSPIYTPDYTH